jgi:hypothetical protein
METSGASETLIFNAQLAGAEATLLDVILWRESIVPLCLVRIRLKRDGQEKEFRSRLDLDKRWFIDAVEGDDDATALLRAWTAHICNLVCVRLKGPPAAGAGASLPPNCS